MTPSSPSPTGSWVYKALRATLHDIAGRLGVLRLAADLADVDPLEMASFHRTAVQSLKDLDDWLKAVRALLFELDRPAGPTIRFDAALVARQALSSACEVGTVDVAESARPVTGDPRVVGEVLATLVRELRRALPAGRFTIQVGSDAHPAATEASETVAGRPLGVMTLRCAMMSNEPDPGASSVSPLVVTLCTELLERQGGTLALARGSANELTVEVRLPMWRGSAAPG